MKITTPTATFTISADPAWPSIPFQTDASGPHTWNWQTAWGVFVQSGSAATPSNQWDAQSAVTHIGGTLTVTAQAGGESATVVVNIVGTNPTPEAVTAFLATQPDSNGFDKILMQESRCRHFSSAGQPIKSYDNGYGMCQLTDPVPKFQEVWNWQHNLQGGLALFASKVAAAKNYLGQSGRTYTQDQVMYESVCRWNGGSYFEWDDAGAQWIRHPNILCDSLTGNFGWDMRLPQNAGQSEAQLHQRDHAFYPAGKPGANQYWNHFGVCYADKVLG